MRVLRLTTILTVLLATLLMAGACGSEEPTATTEARTHGDTCSRGATAAADAPPPRR